MIAIGFAHQFLNQHGHPFFLDPDVGVPRILHRSGVKHRGVNQLDRVRQLPVADRRIFMTVRYDIGFVNPGERQHPRILQDTG